MEELSKLGEKSNYWENRLQAEKLKTKGEI
jgi:hypothetical protein